MKKLVLILLIAVFAVPACITTRSSIEEAEKEQQMKMNVQNLQRGNVDLTDQVSELQEQFRQLNGRIETSESRYEVLSEKIEIDGVQEDEKWRDLSNRYKVLLDSVGELEEKVGAVEAENHALKNQLAALRKANSKKPVKQVAKKKGNYTQAEIDFKNKKWKEAALGYQKYRELNPKGVRYPRATYRMGLCFKNLKLKAEAKVFFQELVDKFPKNEYAKEASQELKKLK